MTQEPKTVPEREDIDAADKWRLEDMYASPEAWEADFARVKALLPAMQAFRGRLCESAETLWQGLQQRDEISRISGRLFAYARMRQDEDNRVTQYQALADRAAGLLTQVGSALAFVVPELLEASEQRVKELLSEHEGLQVYRHHLDEILREKPHTLPAALEALLAETRDLARAPGHIFGMLNNADLRFPVIHDELGRPVELTKANYFGFMESPDREVRRAAFSAFYQTYGNYKHTLAATLSNSVKKDIFYARARRYASALEAALFPDHVPVQVYTNLIATVRQHLPGLQRYLALRKRVLALEELHMYDLYAPLVPDANVPVPYPEALSVVRQALAPLGPDYAQAFGQALQGGWIDVYENRGKTGGAYSWGAYGGHPYVLLNYQGKLNDVFTLAHELGHALHTYYTYRSQPYVYGNYTIFVAEVASTLNETLLHQHLMETTSDPRRKLYLLNHYVDQFRGTVFRQTMLAEFEQVIHAKAEAGEALTPELLCQVYHGLNADYFGSGVVIDPEIDVEWGRIPHFYSEFYVYKYATGFAAATALAEGLRREGEPAVVRYLNFLRSGSCAYPIDLLKAAGVDMTSPEPIAAALRVFEQTVAEMERLLDRT